MLDIREMLRQMRLGASNRAIAEALQASRNTVKKYREWAKEQGLLTGELPPTECFLALLQATMPEAPPPQVASSVELHRKLVEDWLAKGWESQAIHQKLVKEHGFSGSYSAVWRFVQSLAPGQPEATVRVEVDPGQEAQVDFGYVGKFLDLRTGKQRKAWAALRSCETSAR